MDNLINVFVCQIPDHKINMEYVSVLFKKYIIKKETHINNPIIQINKYGKPFLTNSDSYDFNISHSEGIIAGLIVKGSKIGIDVEKKKIIDFNIINYFLNENEKKYFELSFDKKNIFYTFWTLKEAYLKMIGYGLLMDIKSISFNVELFNKNFYQLNNLPAYLYSIQYKDNVISISSEQKIDCLRINELKLEDILREG